MSDDLLESYQRNGFAGPFTLFGPELAAQLAHRLREEVFATRCQIYAHTHADPRTAAFRKSLDPESRRDRHLDSPLLYRMATAPEILTRLRHLLGPNILLWRSDTFEQSAGDKETGAHQDGVFDGLNPVPMIECGQGQAPIGRQTYPCEADIPLSINAWITFSPVRRESGAMWFVPGSHRSVVPYVPGEGTFGRPMVLSRSFHPDEGQVIEMAAGQFLLFDNLVVHGSYPVERGWRLAWTPRYTSTQTLIHARTTVNAQFMDLTHYGALLVAGQDRTRHNVLRSPPSFGTCALLEERAMDDLGLPAVASTT
jgi:non-heme Fe2+,alpha-ketoglutarate-dependent halogenase